MKGIRKYHSFLEARLDMYKEMYKKEVDWKEAIEFHKKFEYFCKRNNLTITKTIYPKGIYFFKSIKEARKDLIKRLVKNACEKN